MGLKGGQFAYKHALHNCSSLDVRVQDVARKIAINLSLQKIIENQTVSNRPNIGKCWVDLTLKLQVLWSCQERERVVTKGFMEREMRYAQEMRELPGELRNVRWLWHGKTVISFEDIGSFQVWAWYRTEWNYDSHKSDGCKVGTSSKYRYTIWYHLIPIPTFCSLIPSFSRALQPASGSVNQGSRIF